MDFSLFYFADDGSVVKDRYRLMLESAKFADSHGFAAVWTPERHFHEFGGCYPNPSVTGAALAAVTSRLEIRAGSVVAPLHHPARIAEEWSVVDNLSGGRAGISLASGWHARDFILRPESYARRKDILLETVDTVRRLWRGEAVAFADGTGTEVPVRIFPQPVRPELPVWVTSGGSVDTFRAAGEAGAGLLTHLLGQDLPELAEKIEVYRAAHAAHHDGPGHVALMIHTLLGADREVVRAQVRAPFASYLRSSLGLIAKAAGDGIDLESLDAEDLEFLVERAVDRYLETSALIGTVADGAKLAGQLRDIGVDDIACLIDFGVEPDVVLGSLEHLDELRQLVA